MFAGFEAKLPLRLRSSVRLDQKDIIIPVSSIVRPRRAADCCRSERIDVHLGRRFGFFLTMDNLLYAQTTDVFQKFLKKVRSAEIVRCGCVTVDVPLKTDYRATKSEILLSHFTLAAFVSPPLLAT
jgi:hypothetical protein